MPQREGKQKLKQPSVGERHTRPPRAGQPDPLLPPRPRGGLRGRVCRRNTRPKGSAAPWHPGENRWLGREERACSCLPQGYVISTPPPALRALRKCLGETVTRSHPEYLQHGKRVNPSCWCKVRHVGQQPGIFAGPSGRILPSHIGLVLREVVKCFVLVPPICHGEALLISRFAAEKRQFRFGCCQHHCCSCAEMRRCAAPVFLAAFL